VIGRGSAGVRLFNVADNEHVVSAAKIGESDEEEEGVEAPVEGGDANPVEGGGETESGETEGGEAEA
jgi:DNA gyrase subunit A